MNTLACSIVFWFAFAAPLEPSQPPAPTPPKMSQIHKQETKLTDGKTTATNNPTQPKPATTNEVGSKTGEQQRENKPTEEHGQSSADWWSKVLLTIFTGVLMCVAFFQMVVAIFQLCIYKAQARYMVKGLRLTRKMIQHLRLEQRAWVGFSRPITTPMPLIVRQTTKSEMPVKNTGRTPAFIDRQIADVALGDAADSWIEQRIRDMANQMATEPLRRTVIPPDSEEKSSFKTTHSEFVPNDDDISKIGSREKSLYIIGMLTYSDVSGAKHFSQCCYIYVPGENHFIGYKKYNEMT